MTFRWYGQNDPVPLSKIRQIPVVDGIVSSLHHIAYGELWSEEDIIKHKDIINSHGLSFEVVESLPVHEDIKLGEGKRDFYIDNYIKSIKRLGKHGVKVICYNFMPVFDWMRSELHHKNADGSCSLAYDETKVCSFNPMNLAEELNLPAWDSYSKERLSYLLDTYKNMNEDKLFSNLKYFLDAVIPAAEKAGISLAIHPDDPPWSIYGLPRIITNNTNLKRFLDLNKSVNNGVTFCTGSFGCSKDNNLTEMIKTAKGRIHFAHLRNVLITGERQFQETAHPSRSGSLDMYEIVKTLVKNGFDGYVRPDHGRNIWDEEKTIGYGLYDRALGAMYIYGLFEAVQKGGKLC